MTTPLSGPALDAAIAEVLALDMKRTGNRRGVPAQVWKWMRPGVLDNTNRYYIYAGAGEYGKHYHASANNEDDAAFISAAPRMVDIIRALLMRQQNIAEAHSIASEALAKVVAERDELRKDAGRYRQLRDGDWIKLERETLMFLSANAFDGIVDAKIDAARDAP